MGKIYYRLFSTVKPQGKDQDSFDSRGRNHWGEDSTWLVDRLEIPGIIYYFFYYMIKLLWLFQKMSCVLSCERENQIVQNWKWFIVTVTNNTMSMLQYYNIAFVEAAK